MPNPRRAAIPDSFRRRRSAPASVRDPASSSRPRVVTGLGSAYSPFDGPGQRRPPTDLELVSAYRNATYVCASTAAEGVAATPLRLYATTTAAKGEKGLRCKSRPLDRARERHLGSIPSVAKRLAGVDRVDEVTEHPILELLDRVNPWMNRSQLLELTQLSTDIAGRYFWFYERGPGGVPVQLWPLPTWLVYVQPDFAGLDVVKNFIYSGGGGQAILRKEDVLFGRDLSLIDPYTQGLGALRASWDLAQIYDKNTAYRGSALTNRGRPDAMLIPTEDDGGVTVGDEAIARIVADYEQDFSLGQAGRLWVPPGGLELKPISWSPQDMGEIALSKGVLQDIARAFKVPTSLIDGESASRAAMDASLLQFARFCLKPRCRKLEEHLNSNFVPQWDERLFLAFDDPVPADRVADREENIAYVNAGIRSRGEVRAGLGDEPMEGDDVLLVPNNLVPLSHAIKPPPDPAEAAGAGGKPPGKGGAAEADDDEHEEGADQRSQRSASKSLDVEGENRPHFRDEGRGPWDGLRW